MIFTAYLIRNIRKIYFIIPILLNLGYLFSTFAYSSLLTLNPFY